MCSVCGNVSTKRELFTDLSLSIEEPLPNEGHRTTRNMTGRDATRTAEQSCLTLSDCMRNFTALESLGQKVVRIVRLNAVITEPAVNFFAMPVL